MSSLIETEVKFRIFEFEKLGKEGKVRFNFRKLLGIEYEADIFSELCFCILTAGFSATKAVKIQSEIGIDGFFNLDEAELRDRLKSLGYRFPDRAKRIVKAREKIEQILKLIKSSKDSKQIRQELYDKNSKLKVEGLGPKEASHFLRNTGRLDVAIVDRHIRRFLDLNKIGCKNYFSAEKALEEIAKDLKISLGELDLVIFYLMTGAVVK
ncbi:MAG: N-glycosylase/DNA lyase [Aquificaceae bacterium]